jgi:hypothetical protein
MSCDPYHCCGDIDVTTIDREIPMSYKSVYLEHSIDAYVVTGNDIERSR